MSIKSKKILNFYIPLFIFLLIVSNLLLSKYFMPYLYIVFISLNILLIILSGLNKQRNFIIFYLYFILIIFIYYVQVYFYMEPENGIKTLFIYTILLFYWVVYFHKHSIHEFVSFYKKTIFIVFIVATLGNIQFFLTPSLFGLLKGYSNNIDWASNQSFSQYLLFFRATSIFGSPQIYGLFMALYVVSIHKLLDLNNFSNKLLISYFLFSGFLSGDKTFVLIIFLFFIYKFFNSRFANKIKILLGAVIVGMILIGSFSSNIRILERTLSINQMIEQENEDSRLDRYNQIIQETNPIIGNGFGTKTNRKNQDLEVAESYIFQLYAEGGILPLVGLLMIILLPLFVYSKEADKYFDMKLIMVCIFISMIVVHAFNNPAFFIFWPFLVIPFLKSPKNKKLNLTKKLFSIDEK